jgi:hypothetical protein
MNCDLACHLIDDYLDNRLGSRDRQRLEKHISACSQCADEMRDRLAFERSMQQSLAASVQSLQLTPDASRGIVRAVESNLRQPTWSQHAVRLTQVTAGAVAIALLLLGLSFLLRRVSTPGQVRETMQSPAGQTALVVSHGDIHVEPQEMRPGDLFTITVPIRSEQSQPLENIRCDLDIKGPTGDYRFVLVAQGPLPAPGLSILRVTPELLAAPAQKQYKMSPRDMVSAPGIYTFRITIFSPAASPVQ